MAEDSSSIPAPASAMPLRLISNSRWAGVDFEDQPFPPPAKLKYSSLGEMFFAVAEEKGRAFFAQVRDPSDNEWLVYTWLEAAAAVRRTALFLTETLKVKHGDRVAIVSGTRWEWVIADLAVLSVGAVSVALYQTLPVAEAGYILWDTDAKVVFVENEEQLAKLRALSTNTVSIPAVENFPGADVQLTFEAFISFESVSADDLAVPVHSLSSIIAASGVSETGTEEKLRSLLHAVHREDLSSIVYTSGTTGPAKGVMQSHDNHLAMVDAVLLSGLVGDGRGVFMFLPLAHSFARLIEYTVLAGAGDYIFPTITDPKHSKFEVSQILRDLRDSSPQILPAVPRIFEKIMDGLNATKPAPLRERLGRWGVRTYREMTQQGAARISKDYSIKGIKRQLVFIAAELLTQQVRRQIFGSRLRYAVSGGAPISLEVLDYFHSIGVLILQGYGLTETTPALAANTPEHNKFGTVGRVFEGVELRLAPVDHEIHARGPNIALGYWRRPEATRAAWLEDGWFATGDIGEVDDEGFLKITDRKKDLIVTAGGKKIAPAIIEGRLRTSPLISNALVFGDRKPYIVALITLDFEAARAWADRHAPALKPESIEELISLPALIKAVDLHIQSVNAGLATYDQIKRISILNTDFTLENQLLSTALKMKRSAVAERFAAEIEALYQTEDGGR